MARSSGMLGILLIFLVAPAIIAVILGIKAYRDIRAHPGIHKGKGMALTGIISGSLAIVMLLLTLILDW